MNSRKAKILPIHTSIANCLVALGYYFPKNDGVCFGASWLFLIAKYMDDLKLNTVGPFYWLKAYQDRLDYIKWTLHPLLQEIKDDLQKNEFMHITNLDDTDDDMVKGYYLQIQTRLQNTVGENKLNELKTFFDPLYLISDPTMHPKLFKKKFLFYLMMRCKSETVKSLQLPDTLDSIYDNRDLFFSHFRNHLILEMKQHPGVYSSEDYSILSNYLLSLDMQNEISFDNFKNIVVPQSQIDVDLTQKLTKNFLFEKMKMPNFKLVKNIINVYTHQKLFSFLQLLLYQLQLTPLPISLGFMVSNNYHSTSIAADPSTIKNGYLFFDINNDVPYINNKSIFYIKDLKTCTDTIISSFKDAHVQSNENDTLALGFSFYCPPQYVNQVNEFINILTDKGAEDITFYEVNQRDILGESYLDLVVDFNDIDLAKKMLPYCKIINDFDSKGYTPLNSACMKNRAKMVDLLLQHGADPNRESKGGTPLTSAAADGLFDIVQLLLRYGANINQSYNGTLPIVFAASRKHFDIAMLLAKIDTEKRYVYTTVVYHAVRHRHMAALYFFINNNCSVNIVAFGVTPLHLAVRNNDNEIVKILLEAGAVVNYIAPNGETPLFVAAKNGNIRIVKLLVEHGANLETASPIESKQPTHVAAKVSFALNQETLFKSSQDDMAMTPLEIARKYKHDDVVQYLEATELQREMDWEEQFIRNGIA